MLINTLIEVSVIVAWLGAILLIPELDSYCTNAIENLDGKDEKHEIFTRYTKGQFFGVKCLVAYCTICFALWIGMIVSFWQLISNYGIINVLVVIFLCCFVAAVKDL